MLYSEINSIYEFGIECFVPRKSPLVQCVHKRIGIKLFNVVNTGLLPLTCHYHHSAYHSGNAGSIAYCLRADLLVAFLVVTAVVNLVVYFLAVLLTYADTADICLADCSRTERCGIGKNCL